MHNYKHDIKKIFFAAAVSAVIVASLFVFNSNYVNESAGAFSASPSSWAYIAKLQAALL